MKRSLITLGVIAGVLAFATPALAHTPSVTPSCSGLAVSLVAYEGTSTNNRVTTTIDNVATVADFGGSYSHTFNWPQAVPHTWSVVIDANRSTGDPTAYDKSFSGTWQACQPATTTTTAAPTTTTAAATTTTLAATATTAAATTTTLPATATTAGSTTTTAAPTTTTTTLVASEAPATTSTTTALIASQARVAPATPVQLPATGSESGRIMILGLAMFGLGLALLGLRWRSRPVSS